MYSLAYLTGINNLQIPSFNPSKKKMQIPTFLKY